MTPLIALVVAGWAAMVWLARSAGRRLNDRRIAARASFAQHAVASLEQTLEGKAEVLQDGSLRVRGDGFVLHARLVRTDGTSFRFRCALGPMPGDVVIRAASAAAQLGLRRSGDDLLTGDPAFDHAVWVQGPDVWTTARLDAAARSAIRALVAYGGALDGGLWTVEAQDRPGDASGMPTLERAARMLRAAGRPFLAHTLPVHALTAIAQADPVPGVRARALLRLFRKPWSAAEPFPEVARHIAGADLIAALASPLPDVVVAAALLLRLEGTAAAVPALRAASAGLDPSVERDALDQAVLAFQARVGPASGGLSLAQDDGALSVAESEGGLAVAHDPTRR